MTDPYDDREPHRPWNELDSEADLIVGADDPPDILQGVEEDEPELDTASLRDTPFRTPHPGDRLTESQLESDLD